MVNVDKAIIARIKKEGKTFEILVDCDNALLFRKGAIESLENVLATKQIYSDVKQGERASEADIKHVFKTENVEEVAKLIIKKGEIQLTTEHKNKLRDEKVKRIANFIHRNAINPTTGTPHPIARIEMVMSEAKVNIDPFADTESQAQMVIEKMRPLLPLKIEVRKIEIVIPGQYTGNAYGVIKKSGKMLQEDWLSDGNLKILLEIPAGAQEELENKINSLTKGSASLEIKEKR
jgi:ribosome maturation protein SDO1